MRTVASYATAAVCAAALVAATSACSAFETGDHSPGSTNTSATHAPLHPTASGGPSTNSAPPADTIKHHAHLPQHDGRDLSRPTVTATKSPSWSALYRSVSSGITRIDMSDCDASYTGTGFLIAPNLVATVSHVVEQASTLRITDPTLGIVTSGTVVGFDHGHDLALIRTDADLNGHVFGFADSAPPIGTDLAAIGFPLAGPMQQTTGHITGNHKYLTVDDPNGNFQLSNMLLSDAALNHGNSGGPWITKSGKVIGLDESGPPTDGDGNQAQGNNGGVSVTDAAPEFAKWSANPQPRTLGACQSTTKYYRALDTLDDYFYDIDNSDYASAFAQLDSANHPNSELASFVDGVQSSQDESPDGKNLYQIDGHGKSDGAEYVDVSFVSHQDAKHGPDGQKCTTWQLRYSFIDANGLELIHDTSAEPGQHAYAAC